LFDIDIPWIADGLRDFGHKRDEMYRIFKSALDKRKIPYTNVQGTYAQCEKFLTGQVNDTFFTLPAL
jgi:HTH-type transcriptional repressor of NAD biosynthesis genes